MVYNIVFLIMAIIIIYSSVESILYLKKVKKQIDSIDHNDNEDVGSK